MKRQLLHTPEGVRDIYNDECEKKLILQDELLKVQTGREIRWYFDRILHLPLRDVPQCILVRRRCRSVSAIWEIHF